MSNPATRSASPPWFSLPLRRIWTLAAILFVVAWALLLTDTLPVREEVGSNLIQLATSSFGAILLLHNSRQRDAVLGRRGTLLAGIALACWAISDLLWAALTHSGWDHLDLINVGYALATILFGAAASLAALGGFRPLTNATKLRIICDFVLLTACSILLWRNLAWVEDSGTAATIGAVTLAVADAFFVVAALTAWARAAQDRRRALSLLMLAALLLFATDMAYSGDLLFASYVGGGLLDFSWSLVTFLIGSIAVLAPPWARVWFPGSARWVGACLAPMAGMATLVTASLQHREHGGFWIDLALVCFGLLLALRLVFFAAEQFVDKDQLAILSEEEAYRADHDDLTGVLARRAFLERAEGVVALHRQSTGSEFGFVWIDIDDFKQVNDTFGHATGDYVLRIVAKRLEASGAVDDMVGRLGGDEFVVLRPNLTGTATAWAERLARVVSTPIDVGGATIRVACSAGVVRSNGRDDLSDLIVDGDLALLQAKRRGRAQVVEFTHAETDPLADAQLLAGIVRESILNRSLVVRYQPVVDLATNEIVGAEALVRMVGPNGRELQPNEFIHLVEVQGLLPQLFDIVLHRALSDFSGLDWRSPRWAVSINVTMADITGPGFVDRVAGALRSTGADPRELVLELNERVAPQRRIVEAVRALEAIGINFALDDFGTQWSHIDQVKELSPAFVKLDRDLLNPSGRGEGHGVLFGAVALAKSLGARIVAEGIETAEHLELAQSAGADLGQGWHWAPDLTIAEFQAMQVRTVVASRISES